MKRAEMNILIMNFCCNFCFRRTVMKKILLISSFLSSVLVLPALAVDCTTVPTCDSLGYKLISKLACDDGIFIKCPIDASYGICVKNSSNDENSSNDGEVAQSWPLSSCKTGDYLNIPTGSNAFCSATDMSGQNYRVMETDNTYIYYLPADINNIQPIPQGSYTTLPAILSAISIAHPGCKIVPFNEIIKDAHTYLTTVGANLEFVAPQGPSNTVIVLENGGYKQDTVFYSGYSQVYACANMYKKASTGSSVVSIPKPDWGATASSNANVTNTCPSEYKYKCDVGYVNDDEYCQNEGSIVKMYKTACVKECNGYNYTCSNNQFNNSGDTCVKTTDGNSVWYKTACTAISCSQYGSNSWYGSAVKCKDYCSSVGAYYEYMGKANDGVTSCYRNTGNNPKTAINCPYCAVNNTGTPSLGSNPTTGTLN